MLKICFACNPNKRRGKYKIGAYLTLSEFGKYSDSNDGLRHRCKKCRQAEAKERYVPVKKKPVLRKKTYLPSNAILILNQATRAIHANSKMLNLQESFR